MGLFIRSLHTVSTLVTTTYTMKIACVFLFVLVAGVAAQEGNGESDGWLDCESKPHGGRYPHPTDCTKFYICYHGHWGAFECPWDIDEKLVITQNWKYVTL